MMGISLDGLKVSDVDEKVIRNIVSINTSQDLFDDLSTDASAWDAAQKLELDTKPASYRSRTPIIDRPFEDADWFNAIGWPFKHWQASRFSDGSFGVWYGCDSPITSAYETVHHWYHGLLSDAGFTDREVIGERKLYEVKCKAALLDFRTNSELLKLITSKNSYIDAQAIGKRLHGEGAPGLITKSVRYLEGTNYVILNPKVLFEPTQSCQLRYTLTSGKVVIEKQIGQIWFEIDPTA
jgi:hypothetical protein